MNCPVCKTVALSATDLENSLSSRRCPKCGGQWIRGEQYLLWLQRRDPRETPVPTADCEPSQPASDTTGVKLCPECGRFLTRNLVGRGADFHIDRCAGGCGGIWLDVDEWQALKTRGLHDDLHFVFSAAWQAEVNRQQQAVMQEHRMKERLGETDHAELLRIKKWLDTHAHRSELYAYLLNQQPTKPGRPI